MIQRRGNSAANFATARDNEETDVHETETRQAANLETKITLGLVCESVCGLLSLNVGQMGQTHKHTQHPQNPIHKR